MLCHVYANREKYPIAVLVKDTSFNIEEIKQHYVDPLIKLGHSIEDIIICSLPYDPGNKVSVATIKKTLAEMMPNLEQVGVRHIYCAESMYFKKLAGIPSANNRYGERFEHLLGDYSFNIFLGVNHKSLFFNDANIEKLTLSLSTFSNYIQSKHINLLQDAVIDKLHAAHLADGRSIAALKKLLVNPVLAVDIETTGLQHYSSEIASIAFAPDKLNSVAIAVRDKTNYNETLRQFFEAYEGKLVFHNASFDIKFLVYNLWMERNPENIEGMIQGIECLTRDFEDTKVISYLALNTASGNDLKLKNLARFFTGHYAVSAEEIKHISSLTIAELLEYNAIDTLATMFVLEKYYPIMVADKQEKIYKEIMLPSLVTIIAMELTGVPIDPAKLMAAEHKLRDIVSGSLSKLGILHTDDPFRSIKESLNAPEVLKQVNEHFRHKAMMAKNAKLKVKQHPIEAFNHIVFNPGSPDQLSYLLYEVMGLPILDKTPTGNPSTKVKVLKKLKNHTANQNYLDIIDAIIELGNANKILTTFIPAFWKGHRRDDGYIWLHGSFNLGGTKSGRLSSSDPNLQNLPSGSIFGKLIKECFVTTNSLLFCGADFNSLEDYISALTTKDPNKLKVYTDGFDGHSLKAFTYWPEKFPYDEMTPERSFEVKKDPILDAIRSSSKGPTFALTYQGTYLTLMRDLGFPEEQAKAIEANYKNEYKVSIAWVDEKLQRASEDGYVTLAFGLRLRTPRLKKTVSDRRYMPSDTLKECRTAGNALGQSYGLLTNRAANAFMQKVWRSKFRTKIRISMQIHDAIYLLIDPDYETIQFVNDNLIGEMRWQNLPELEHPTVKLGANLDLFAPSWANPVTIPNDINVEEFLKSVGF